MKLARLHIRAGTMVLPDRTLQDGELSDDIIDIELNDNERVMQVDLTRVGAVYHSYEETPEQLERRVAKVNSVEAQAIVASLGGTHRPASATPKTRHDRVKGYSEWKYRVATIEELSSIAAPAGETVQDADVIEEGEL